MNLGENIYRLRTQRNLSQEDFAAALEVSRQSVSKWENGTAVPELEKLIKMSQLFGITLDELATGKQTEVPPVEKPKTEVPPSPVSTPPTPKQPQSITQTAIGIALLCCSILSLVLFLIFGVWIWILLVSIPLGILSAVSLNPSKEFRRKLLRAIGWILIGLFAVLFLIWAILVTRPFVEEVTTTMPASEVIVYPADPEKTS